MRAVIIGAGLVGSSLAAMMREENHNIVVVDRDPLALERLGERLDVQTLVGHGGSPKVLLEAKASEADLLIAVTDVDEVNMVSAMTAKTLGVRTTVARIRSREYLPGVRALYRNLLGIDFAVSPEAIAALKLADIVHTPGASWVESFADGRIRLMRLTLGTEGSYLGIKLKNFEIPNEFLLVGILRRGQLIIPSGDDALEALDDIYIVVNADEMKAVRKLFKPQKGVAKSVMIAWGTVGATVASLLEEEMKVRIIEPDYRRCQELATFLERTEVIHGSPNDVDLVARENVGKFDAFMALGPQDEMNVMACLLARELGMNTTAAMVANAAYSDIVEKLPIDVTVAPRTLVANTIIRFLRRREVVAMATLEGGKGQVLEFAVLRGARIAGRPLRKARLPEGVVIGAIVRYGHVLIPRGDDVIEVGDHAIVFCKPEGVPALEKLFAAG